MQTPLSVGIATVLISFLILLMWLPLRQAPGLGTVMNAILVGLTIDVVLPPLPDSASLGIRLVMLFGGIAVVAIGSGFYLGARLGPGPRDGLMTGLHRRTGWSVRLVRGGVEIAAAAGGAVLGGTVGLGTVAFALLIGPAVQLALAVGRTDAASL